MPQDTEELQGLALRAALALLCWSGAPGQGHLLRHFCYCERRVWVMTARAPSRSLSSELSGIRPIAAPWRVAFKSEKSGVWSELPKRDPEIGSEQILLEKRG